MVRKIKRRKPKRGDYVFVPDEGPANTWVRGIVNGEAKGGKAFLVSVPQGAMRGAALGAQAVLCYYADYKKSWAYAADMPGGQARMN